MTAGLPTLTVGEDLPTGKGGAQLAGRQQVGGFDFWMLLAHIKRESLEYEQTTGFKRPGKLGP